MHNIDFKLSGLKIEDIKKMVKEKKILYDHFADQKKIKKWDSHNNIRIFIEISKLTGKKITPNQVQKIKSISNNSERSTDKLPINFLSVGFIKIILPKSKIIHCYRNPKDNCLSIYKNHFPGGKINFSYDLDEIVEYYKLYSDF